MADDCVNGNELLLILASCIKESDSTRWNWCQITDIMKRLKLWAKKRERRTEISIANIEHTKEVVIASQEILMAQPVPENETLISCLKALTEAFRFLRNCTAEVPENQQSVVDVGVVDQMLLVMSTLIKPQYQELNEESAQFVSDAVKSGLQLLGNIVVGNKYTQENVWSTCFPSFFLCVLASSNYQAQDCLCMVIFNCLSYVNRAELVSSHEGHKILSHILHLCADHDELEWGVVTYEGKKNLKGRCSHLREQLLMRDSKYRLELTEKLNRILYRYFIMDSLLMSGHISDVYSGIEFDPSARLILLDLIQVKLTGMRLEDPEITEPKQRKSSIVSSSVPVESLIFLSEDFEARSSVTIYDKVYSSADHMMDALLVSRLLRVMCTATGMNFSTLRNRTELLQLALSLLRETSAAENRDMFSSVTSVPRGAGAEDLSPSHGFKRDLVRLIGNMCYQHRLNQDKVREDDGIPLILDHCSIDDYNPYICQWAIFAVRNLLFNNIENQHIVAALENTGLADTSRLRQFGVDVQKCKDGRIKLVPTEK